MVGKIEIDFKDIRPYEGDKRKGFEELVCQLARREDKPGAKFRRIEGSGGDAGIEAYWIFEDETEHGYQAKYFLATKYISWSQIDKSVKTALEQHPNLKQYSIAIACDLTDRSGNLGKGKTGWEHWETHKSKWEQWANAKGMNVEFIPWTKSELTDRLAASTANRGLLLFWFNVNLFDETWFQNLFERVKADLDERYQPEDHVEVWLARAFEGLARSSAYLDLLSNWFITLPGSGDLLAAIGKLDSPIDIKLIQDLEVRCAELRRIGESIYAFEGQPFPIAEWQVAIRSAFDAVESIREWLNGQDKKDNDTIKKVVSKALSSLSKIDAHLDSTPIHLGANISHEIRIEADLRRILIVVGEAGIGKSHLFADAIDTALRNNAPAILLLGQHFPGKDIRREFLNFIDLSHQDFDTVLQALNAAGEASQTRLIILIDALNETQTLRVWPDQLAGFLSDILKYEWLAIGFSLRPEYEEVLIPERVKNNSARVICHGIQTPEEQEQAKIQYFEKRGIIRPTVPWVAPEFSNFLFLKTCCDALQEFGIKEFPRGLHGSRQVLRFYLDSVDRKIRKLFPEIAIPKSAIINSILKIARSMAMAKADFIYPGLAKDICRAEFGSEGPSLKISWLSILTSEGLFRRDHLFDKDNADPLASVEEIYRFTYQRFSDHLIVQALLEKVSDIDNAFSAEGPLGFLVEKGKIWQWRFLWGALAVQIPEKFIGKELLDVIPALKDKPSYYYPLFEAFEQSLLWRSSEAFSARTLELFNKFPRQGSDPRLEILIKLATLQEHPWNAEFLDRNLKRLPMPERDAFWTVQINYITDDDFHPLWELIHWSLTANLEQAETETLRLAAITLNWMLTSSNRTIRDTATKALISIFVNRPQLIPEIFERFQNVDDLYVMERLCAAVLGAITRFANYEDIKTSAKTIYYAIFTYETPPLNINLRDYARATIEFALSKGCLHENIDIEKYRPPYRSKWPLDDIDKEEVEKIAKERGGDQILFSALNWGDFARYEIEPLMHHFTSIPSNEPRPLNDEERGKTFLIELSTWDIQKQEAFAQLKSAIDDKKASSQKEIDHEGGLSIVTSYSEEKIKCVEDCEDRFITLLNADEKILFEQIMLPALFPDRIPYEERRIPQFDANFAKRWVTNRAYEYGWNTKLFPNDAGRQGIGRSRNQVERIGKKYQWLALSEFLARLSDNVWVIGGWPERAMTYDHQATDWFVRDIEPSILTDPAKLQEADPWWQALPLNLEPIEDEGMRTWPFQGEPPNKSHWMDVVAPDGKPWLLLYGFFSVREGRSKESVTSISTKRDIFVRVSSILVEIDTVKATISKFKGYRLADPSGHETVDWTDGPFLCEYPWRNTWKADQGIYENGFRNLEGIRYIRPVARHVWESHLDLSLQNGSSICIPNPWIGEKLGLKVNLEKPGEGIAESDGQVIFLDPTFGISGSSAAVIDRAKFFDFLKKEGLECLWIVAGERNSYPSGHAGDYSCRSFASVYRWTGKKWEGVRWHKDDGRTPNH